MFLQYIWDTLLKTQLLGHNVMTDMSRTQWLGQKFLGHNAYNSVEDKMYMTQCLYYNIWDTMSGTQFLGQNV